MRNLHDYLNDHLAGSVGALELLDRLIEASDEAGWSEFLRALRRDIEEDQEVLTRLLREVGGEESTIRKAGAWLLEKFSRGKLPIDGTDGGLGKFEALEGLSLGIMGKRSLWKSLDAAAALMPSLRKLNLAALAARAAEQFERVEARALAMAPSVLTA